jgi:hypothetical protein
MIKFLMLIFFSLIYLSGFGQKRGYHDGYLVTIKMDTIKGWVSDRDIGSFQELYRRIRFVEEGKKRKRKYRPDQLIAYGYGAHSFESVPLAIETHRLVQKYYVRYDNPMIFLKLVRRNEYLTHYEMEFQSDDDNYIDSFPLFYMTNSNEMVRVTQGLLGLKRKRLSEYFNNCQALSTAIQSREINQIDEVYDFYSLNCVTH